MPAASPRSATTGKALLVAGVIALLIGVFAVGSLVLGLNSNREMTTRTNAGDATLPPPAPTATVSPTQTVPILSDTAMTPAVMPGGPIDPSLSTSTAPLPDLGPAAQYGTTTSISTATVTSSVPPPATGTDNGADPRSILQITPSRPQQPVQPKPRHRSEHTNPHPISQPLGNLPEAEESGTVKLDLTISPSGRVKEVNVLESLPGMTAAVIGAVQQWTFEPATEDGQPVEGHFVVDIDFNSHD